MAKKDAGDETPKPKAARAEPKSAEPKAAEPKPELKAAEPKSAEPKAAEPKSEAKGSGSKAESDLKVQNAVAEAMQKLSADGDAAKQAADELAKKMPDQLLSLFTMVLAQAKVKQDEAAAQAESSPSAPSASKAAESKGADVEVLSAETRKEPTEFEKQLQGSVKKALEGYVNDKVVGDQPIKTEINVDAEFLKQHGPGMLASAIQGFAKAIIPEEFKVDLDKPTATTDQGSQDGENAPAPGEKQQVSLKLDLGGMIQGFFANLAKPPSKPPQ